MNRKIVGILIFCMLLIFSTTSLSVAPLDKYGKEESTSMSGLICWKSIVIIFSRIIEDLDVPESDFQYDIHPGNFFTGIFRIEIEDNDGTQFYYISGLYFLGIHIGAGDVYSSGYINDGGATFKMIGIGFGKIDFTLIY